MHNNSNNSLNIKLESSLVSVVIPTYNRSFSILDSINSVICQSYKNVEIIIVDDGSVDDTELLIKKLVLENNNIKYIKQKKSGACTARNYGLSVSNGDYIIFLDSDDILMPNHIETYCETAKKNIGCCVYGAWEKYKFSSGAYELMFASQCCGSDDMLEEWLKGWWVFTSCIMWPKNVLQEIGGWDVLLNADQDGDIAMRALINGTKFIYCLEALPVKIVYHVGLDSISAMRSLSKLRSRQLLMMKIERLLIDKNMYGKKYKKALAIRYYNLSYHNLEDFPEFSDECYEKFKSLNYFGRPPGSVLNWIFVFLLGLRRKERFSRMLKCFFSSSYSDDKAP